MRHQYWFRPKTFGYGATPNTWEGWLAVAIYVLVVWACAAGAAAAFHGRSLAQLAISLAVFAAATALMIAVSVQKTDGALRWRWGTRSIDSGKND